MTATRGVVLRRVVAAWLVAAATACAHGGPGRETPADPEGPPEPAWSPRAPAGVGAASAPEPPTAAAVAPSDAPPNSGTPDPSPLAAAPSAAPDESDASDAPDDPPIDFTARAAPSLCAALSDTPEEPGVRSARFVGRGLVLEPGVRLDVLECGFEDATVLDLVVAFVVVRYEGEAFYTSVRLAEASDEPGASDRYRLAAPQRTAQGASITATWTYTEYPCTGPGARCPPRVERGRKTIACTRLEGDLPEYACDRAD